MRFQGFWRLYLQAHRLPGTRALHYFATVVGILSTIEAIATRQPLIFAAGIVLSYAIAIAAHWFVEGNQPLIRVNAFWGAVADLRMCWLALTGRLSAEMIRKGMVAGRETGPAGSAFALAGRRHRAFPHYALVLASAAGLGAGVTDLRDLFEPTEHLAYPAIQVGAPIIAFSGALMLACSALFVANRAAVLPKAAPMSMGAAAVAGWPAGTPADDSVLRATLALTTLGLAAFVLAELVEHGIAMPHVFAAGATLVALCGIGGAVAWQLFPGRAIAAWDAGSGSWTERDAAGPATRGLRVDGRAEWVDVLESALSFGRRRHILAATLAAAAPCAGSRLADIGCGTGELVISAAQNGAAAATGIDATPAMIALARQRARDSGSAAQFEVAAAEALPFADGTLDIVTSTYFFHHLPSEVKRQALREMWRVLAPGGRLVITDYGRPRGLTGFVASFPMRFNFHEYVRPQLAGELERMVLEEGLGPAERVRAFLGYIAVLRVVKPANGTA
jgi:ubiquinone/menaquinone biosynthesis C-methylase UbiE